MTEGRGGFRFSEVHSRNAARKAGKDCSHLTGGNCLEDEYEDAGGNWHLMPGAMFSGTGMDRVLFSLTGMIVMMPDWEAAREIVDD
jgi:hypothetical protein